MPGYREEEGVAPDSMTETYVAAKLYVDNWRWADTPFYVRMGKRLRAARRRSRSSSSARRTRRSRTRPRRGCGRTSCSSTSSRTRACRSRSARRCRAQGMTIRTVHMDFLYGGAFRTGLPEAYERLILDAMLGDATLFTRVGRGRGAVGARRRDRRGVAARPARVPELRGGHVGAGGGRRAHAPRRPLLAAALRPSRRHVEWSGVTSRSPRSSASSPRLRDERLPGASTRAAHERDDAHRLGAAGVGGGGASDARGAGGAASVAHDHAAARAGGRATTGSTRVASVQSLRPSGATGRSPPRSWSLAARRARAARRRASSLPLLVSDLPVFLRWRGEPPSARTVRAARDLADRLVVDSSEWHHLPRAYGRLPSSSSAPPVGHRVAAHSRWRRSLAALWPEIADRAS